MGYKLADVNILYANEFIPKAVETYKLNFPNTIVDNRDIRTIQPDEILKKIKLKKGELDFLDGSPPCASFSMAGKRHKNWGQIKKYSDTKQRTDDLFYEYIRMVKGIQPKIFIAENVKGLTQGKAKGHFNLFLNEFNKLGYNVKASVLNASYLDVPQMRERVFFIGVRKDLKQKPSFPKKKQQLTAQFVYDKKYPIEDVCWDLKPCYLPHLPKLRMGESATWYFSQLRRNHYYKPSYTITASYGSGASALHPYEDRWLSIAELKDICTFPPYFKFNGTYRDTCERMGRSVPPKMMYNIVKHLKKEIFNENTSKLDF